MKQDIYNLSLANLSSWMVDEIKTKPFRVDQLLEALWKHQITSFDEITVFPKSLRTLLDHHFSIPDALQPIDQVVDRQGVKKVVFKLNDGLYVESVGLPKNNQHLTFCLSSQVGCAMNCSFCATATAGFKRHLTCGEMIAQLRGLVALYKKWPTNLVWMGMGEPLQNLDALRSCLDILAHPRTLAWSPKRTTISTCGWIPGIQTITKHPLKAQLAISLNAVTNSQRSQIMPVNKQFSIEALLASVRAYQKTNPHRITFEYVLIHDFNDHDQDAIILSRLLKNINAKVNVIPYNPVQGKLFRAPSETKINSFMAALKQAGITATCRRSQGQGINAACGQLAGQVARRKK